MDLALPLLAVVAGFVSISSPCVLPLIPGYISYITALPVPELGTAQARRTGLRASLLFVAGFTVVFTALGAGFALVGSLLLRNADTITRILAIAGATQTAGWGAALLMLYSLGLGIPFVLAPCGSRSPAPPWIGCDATVAASSWQAAAR